MRQPTWLPGRRSTALRKDVDVSPRAHTEDVILMATYSGSLQNRTNASLRGGQNIHDRNISPELIPINTLQIPTSVQFYNANAAAIKAAAISIPEYRSDDAPPVEREKPLVVLVGVPALVPVPLLVPAGEDGCCEEPVLAAETVVAGCAGEVDEDDCGDLTGFAGLVGTLFPVAWDGLLPPTGGLGTCIAAPKIANPLNSFWPAGARANHVVAA